MSEPSGNTAPRRWRGWARRPDGTRLAIQVTGPRTAPALLLLQGQANSHAWWDRLRGELSRRWMTITFDYRGTGATELTPEAYAAGAPPWSTALFAEDAAAVLTAVGRPRADVYATSMGGRVAQELAITRPETVGRLVLACTSPGGFRATERRTAVRRDLASPDPDVRLRTMIDLFYSPAWVAAYGGYDGVPRDLLGDPSMSAEARRRHLEVSSGHDAAGRLSRITAPTLVMHGIEDTMTPAVNASTIADLVPGAKLALFSGGRHGFFDELSRDVTPRVVRFLTER
ncbi:alpha/beta fold hydrolase [Nocardioides albertanoniae]|nr:alpha/beta fold hydrolase [Nocardioides albertanoniae]